MAAIGNKILDIHHNMIEDIIRKMPLRTYLYDNAVKLGRYGEDSTTTIAIKILAPIALATVAAYFCPAAGVAKYAIKAVVWCAAYTLSFPVLGVILKVVVSCLKVNADDSFLKKLVKQAALPVLAGFAAYYLFPVAFSLSTRVLFGGFVGGTVYVVFVREKNAPSLHIDNDTHKENLQKKTLQIAKPVGAGIGSSGGTGINNGLDTSAANVVQSA